MLIEIRHLFPFIKSCELFAENVEIATIKRGGFFVPTLQINWNEDKFFISEKGFWKNSYHVFDSKQNLRIGATKPTFLYQKSPEVVLSLSGNEYILSFNKELNHHSLYWKDNKGNVLVEYDVSNYFENGHWILYHKNMLEISSYIKVSVGVDKSIKALISLGIFIFMLYATYNVD